MLLDHPIGLACLYMDDGSLIINSSTKDNISIYIFPQIILYTLNFSKEENIILKNHIKNTFNIEFSLKKRPDGKNYALQLNKRNELMKFINIVKPFVEEINCMKYKVDINKRLENKKSELEASKLYSKISVASLNVSDNTYSTRDEKLIIYMKNNKFTDKEISQKINRPYWGLVDKIRRMKKESKL